MTDTLVIRDVRAVDPAAGLDAVVDIVVERGRIAAIGPGAGAAAAKGEKTKVISKKGALAFPGLVDIHAHVREPGHEYKEDVRTALASAAAGGFVDVCCMPNTKPVNDTRAITEMLVAKAKELGGTRLHPIGAITVGLGGEKLTEMADLKSAGAVGVSDDGRCVTHSATMRRALEYAHTFGMPVIQHAEDHALTEGADMHEGAISTRLGLRGWPRVAEDVIVARDVILAEYTGARYHLAHVSTLGAVRIIREAKSRGIAVTAEVTPHHLLLTDKACLGYDTACKVNPPLREDEDVEALRLALADGTIDCIATDHAPHSVLEKDCEFSQASPGMIGLELCVPLLLGLVRDGKLPMHRFVTALTAAPAKIVDLDAPTLRVGARADIVLVDPDERYVLDPSRMRTKSQNTPFKGREVQGRVVLTMAAGQVIFEYGA